MATYYIPTDYVGGEIPVSEGDIFIFEAGANTDVTFSTLDPDTNFSIQFNESNVNAFRVEITQRLHPNITVADNVDIGSVHLKATAAESSTVTIGNNVTLERYEGSKGVDTVDIGDDFTTFVDFTTDGGDDTITIGQNATAPKFDAGGDNDTVNTADPNVTITNAETVNFVCYAPGTLIDTPDGPRAVETLKPGDLVMTLDHGPQVIRWTRSGDHPLEDTEVDDKPVLIQAGALGHNRPAQDLIVSPQHCILVGGGQLTEYSDTEAFAPAKALTGLPGVRHTKGKTKITYVHFACDRHEVVTANGCLSESLLLGPMVVNGLSSAERQALTDLFGPALTPDAAMNGPAARERLKNGAFKRQIAKHLKERGKLVAKEIRKWDRDLAMEQWEADPFGEAMANGRKPDFTIAC